MKTKNNLLGILAGMITLLLIIGGCAKDEIPKPVITLHELGLNNSAICHPGEELHIDAEIVAEGKIDVVVVEIHYEGTGDGWEFQQNFTEYTGLKNIDFHKHIDVPVDALPGDYHFHMKVTDMQGNMVQKEAEIEVRQP
jgi:hypothetical protein